MLFGQADLMTQRRLHQDQGSQRSEDALVALERYANAASCRQQILCAHFTGAVDDQICGKCDACAEPDRVQPRERAIEAPIAILGSAEQLLIIEAVRSVHRKVGKGNLAKALRGSKSKSVVAHGLDHIPQYGVLCEASEASIVATIDQLIRERRLVRKGRKYPTVSLPGASSPRRMARGSRTGSVILELDTYRKRMARQLKWKAYMVFQHGVIIAIDKARPTSKDALARIPGLGPSKIARFGDDILAVVRRHAES